MKKLFLFSLLSCLILVATAEEKEKKELKRPRNVKMEMFDEFKDSSFDNLEASKRYMEILYSKENLTEKDIREIKKMQEELTVLDQRAEVLMKKVKRMATDPRQPRAFINTKKSKKALTKTKNNIEVILSSLNE